MLQDFNDITSGEALTADICIIGSGAAGISIAREFINSSTSVLVLEGGSNVFKSQHQEPYKSQVVGLPHEGIHSGRIRTLGGTTTKWAGQSLPLFDIDFQHRDWVPYSGWPFNRDFLTPFYLRAEQVLQVAHSTYDLETWPHTEPPPSYNSASLTHAYSQFAKIPDFAAKYRAELEAAANITVLTHANVISLEATQNADALKEVKVRSFKGRELSVRARFFIVCCGGIETARLLLSSTSVEANGVGNKHDLVGRFFQDHPGIIVPIYPRNLKQFSDWYSGFWQDGTLFYPKIVASDELQRKHKLLNIHGYLCSPFEHDNSLKAAAHLYKVMRGRANHPELLKNMTHIASNPGKITWAAYCQFVLRQPLRIGHGKMHLLIGVEQAPNPQSRVILSKDRDKLGLRRSVLNWQLTSAEANTVKIFAQTLKEEWGRLNIADVDMDHLHLKIGAEGKYDGFIDAYHHMGTTRMGTDPSTSVVNRNCQVHGYDNLYIASSSVFPTGGFSNPTLTILALCMLISDGIKSRLHALP